MVISGLYCNSRLEETPIIDPLHICLSAEFDGKPLPILVNLISLHPIPEANFAWSDECLTDDPIVFRGTEKLFSNDITESREWKFYDIDGNLEEILTDEQPMYHFGIPANYLIGYHITTNYGCSDSIEKQISLVPTYNIAKGSYYQDFETTPDFWSSVSLKEEGHNSWSWDSVNLSYFPYWASSGTMAWYTKLPKPEIVENSAVMTPCFNFQDISRPMMTLDIRRSMDHDREGAVVQYTTDNGKTWQNIGTVNGGGLNWYNSSRITDGPAYQTIGWTGLIDMPTDLKWLTTGHHLDPLVNQKAVRFRIVYGSRGDNTIRNEGFAFDNFFIGQRTKTLVMEYFTNANDNETKNTDTLVNFFANNLYKDIIDIQYHTSYPIPDRINLDNPTPAHPVSFRLFDLSGKCIFEKQVPAIQKVTSYLFYIYLVQVLNKLLTAISF